MDLAIWTAIIFFGGMFSSTDAGKRIIVTSYGNICTGQCKKNGWEYYYCHTKNSWDYCSPIPGMGAYGKLCKDECASRGEDYLWCHTFDESWDYCNFHIYRLWK